MLEVLMKTDKKFKRNCIHKTWMIIGQMDRDTDRAESKAFFDCIGTSYAQEVFSQSSWLSYKCSFIIHSYDIENI